MRIGALTVIEARPNNGGIATVCRCDCGVEVSRAACGLTPVAACSPTCPCKPRPKRATKPKPVSLIKKRKRRKPKTKPVTLVKKIKRTAKSTPQPPRTPRPTPSPRALDAAQRKIAKERMITWDQVFGDTASGGARAPRTDYTPRVYRRGETVIALLACGDVTSFAELLPSVGQRVLCMECGERQAVIELVPASASDICSLASLSANA